MFVAVGLMNRKGLFSLSPVGLGLLLCTSALVASASSIAFGQQLNSGGNQNSTAINTISNTGTSTGGTINCDRAASLLRGMVLPNSAGTCDIAVPLQGLQVRDTATGASLNKLLIMNPLFEFLAVSNQTTGGNQTTVYGFAEFALMQGQLTSATKMLSNSSWNIVAVHNHVIGESPGMIFIHAIAHGDVNTLARDGRAILDALMAPMQSPSGNPASTSAGGNQTTGGAAGPQVRP